MYYRGVTFSFVRNEVIVYALNPNRVLYLQKQQQILVNNWYLLGNTL